MKKSELAFDPIEAVTHLARVDVVMRKLIARAGSFEMEVRHLHNPFEALARNIIYQQLHGRAAAAIHERVLAVFGKTKLDPQEVLDAAPDDLRRAGLSKAKLAALRDLAAKTLDGTVPTLARLRRMSDEEIIQRLTTVRGIGQWTVEMLLMFRLGRPDVLPVGDYAIRKGFGMIYELKEMPTPREVKDYGELWRPFRSAASWYLWRAIDLSAPSEIKQSAKKARKTIA